MRDLSGNVVVITGASSGLGHEAALQLAERRCRLVLAARSAETLDQVARSCARAGGEALAVVTDVTIEAEVQRLAEAALARFARIDVWINNAGVAHFARLDEGPLDAHRRVIETNLMGAMLGARAALAVFRRQRAGILVNVSSMLGKIGQPYVPSYVASKFGIRGLSDALRVDVADLPAIHVCTLYPYAIDTPHFERGGNAIGREAHAMSPVQAPSAVARALVSLVERPRRERHVPRIAFLALSAHFLAPRIFERLLARALARWHFAGAESRSAGTLYASDHAPATSRGTRAPRLGALRLALWAARELVRMAFEGRRPRFVSPAPALSAARAL